MLELVRYKKDKTTKEEKLVVLSLYKEDVLCFYKDRKGIFILIKQGYLYKVPYELEELTEYLEM